MMKIGMEAGNWIKNMIAPAVCTMAGHSISLSKEIEWHLFDRKPSELLELAKKFLETSSFTLQDIWPSCEELSYDSLANTFHEHSFEIQTAALWGITASVSNTYLKSIRGIREYHTTRALLSTALGAALTTGVFFATQSAGMTPEFDPTMFIDVAARVAIVGGSWKMLNATSRFILDKTPVIMTKVNQSGQKILKAIDWPANVSSSDPKKSKEKTEIEKLREEFTMLQKNITLQTTAFVDRISTLETITEKTTTAIENTIQRLDQEINNLDSRIEKLYMDNSNLTESIHELIDTFNQRIEKLEKNNEEEISDSGTGLSLEEREDLIKSLEEALKKEQEINQQPPPTTARAIA